MKTYLPFFVCIAFLFTSCKDKNEPEPVEPVNLAKDPGYDEKGILKWEDTHMLTTYYTLIDTVNYYAFFPRINTRRKDSSDMRVEFTLNNVPYPHISFEKQKNTDGSTWNFYFHIKLKPGFFFKHNDKAEAKIFLKDSVITRVCTYKLKTESHFDIYELNFGMNRNDVIQRELKRFATPDLIFLSNPAIPNEFSIPNYGRILTNRYNWQVTNVYTFNDSKKLKAVSEYIPSNVWDKTNIINKCKAMGLKEEPLILKNKLDKEYTWTNGKIKYTLNQRLSEYESNSLTGVTFEKLK